MSTPSSHSAITEAERKRRKEAVDYARASVGLEGFKLNQADELHAERYINGEIDLSEFVKLRDGPPDEQ